MFKFAIPAVAALGLIAVAAQSVATDARATDAEIQPSAIEASAVMGWHLSHEGKTAKLAYGIANSDQLALMLMCAPGQTQAVVYGDVAPATPRLTKAVAGGPLDPFTGGLVEDTRISLRDPTLLRLVRDGKLAVKGDAGDFELKASLDERRVIGEFVSYCSEASA